MVRTPMGMRVAAYQHGAYPRSEDVVSVTRGLERGRNTPDEVAAAFGKDRRDFISLQREAGMDLFSDGLITWQDIFRPLVESSGGLEARTLVRWFDNNSFFRAPEVSGDLTLVEPVPRSFEADGDVPQPRMATLPSPYLFSRAAAASGDRNALMMDLTREVLRPVIHALAGRGYTLFHLQEPWLVYFGMESSDWDDFEKALIELREGLAPAGGRAVLALHTYFADAAPHIDRLRRLPVDAVGIDFVQTDLDSLGSKWETGIVAGVLDGRSSPVESARGTAEFARRVAEQLEPQALYLSSNSELEYLPADVAAAKVRRLGEVSARTKELLG